MSVRPLAVLVAALAVTGSTTIDGTQPSAAAEALQRVKAAYSALQSLSVTAVVVVESANPGGPLVSESHAVALRYRAPRNFYFEFVEAESAGADRLVILV